MPAAASAPSRAPATTGSASGPWHSPAGRPSGRRAPWSFLLRQRAKTARRQAPGRGFGRNASRSGGLQGLVALLPVARAELVGLPGVERSEAHTSELQSLMRISYAG